jgi:hypothetical protein
MDYSQHDSNVKEPLAAAIPQCTSSTFQGDVVKIQPAAASPSIVPVQIDRSSGKRHYRLLCSCYYCRVWWHNFDCNKCIDDCEGCNI